MVAYEDQSAGRLNLAKTDLRGAQLWRAHLEGADLEGAHLEGVHLESANLEAVHLEGADLEGAHLERAYLWRAHLEGANLRGAHLERARPLGSAPGTRRPRRSAPGRRQPLGSATGRRRPRGSRRAAQEQLAEAFGDEKTKVADELRPPYWPAATPTTPGCVHQIQMSPSLPFTDVTGVGRGALAQRSARPAPDAPEQEAALVVLPSELTLARLVEKLSRP